jgi:hypothetical protein
MIFRYAIADPVIGESVADGAVALNASDLFLASLRSEFGPNEPHFRAVSGPSTIWIKEKNRIRQLQLEPRIVRFSTGK